MYHWLDGERPYPPLLTSVCSCYPVLLPIYRKWLLLETTIELPHDKTYKTACVPSEDSDQPGHPPRLIRVFAVHMKKAWVLTTHWVHSEDSDQTGRMPRLIWFFAGRTVTLLVLSWFWCCMLFWVFWCCHIVANPFPFSCIGWNVAFPGTCMFIFSRKLSDRFAWKLPCF